MTNKSSYIIWTEFALWDHVTLDAEIDAWDHVLHATMLDIIEVIQMSALNEEFFL